MNRKEVLALFKEFLVEHDSLDEFIENCTNNVKVETMYENFIVSSFLWDIREDEKLSWSSLDTLWKKRLREKGYEC